MNLNKHIFSLSKRLCNANFYALALIYFFNFHCELVYGLQNENSLTDNDAVEYEFENKIYASTIKSVEIRRGLEIPSYPTLLLNSGEFFTIEFDDLNEEEVDYYFTLKHCDRNWNESDLESNEYINGFNELWIDDVETSFNTAVKYTHYEFNFPNESMAPIISGNYLLVVYNEDTPETAVFTARLVIYEQLIYYRSNVKEASVVDERSYRQELDFDILYSNYEITRPYEDIHNVLLQNFNWHSKIDNLKPMFVKNNEMNYDYGEENTFSGLNEFRFLSIAGLNSINAKIKSLNINATDLVPEIELFPSESRRFKLYTTLPDINGDFKIDSQLGNDDDVESEYCRVKFSLPVDQELPKGNEIYVFGNLSFNSFLPEYKLAFNSETKSYEGTLLLKQGFYNFMYVLKYYDEIQTDYFEGEHFQTDNDFHIITYDSNPNIGYDRIIGFLETNTFNEN